MEKIVEITADEYREYQELLKERDRTVLTFRAQWRARGRKIR